MHAVSRALSVIGVLAVAASCKQSARSVLEAPASPALSASTSASAAASVLGAPDVSGLGEAHDAEATAPHLAQVLTLPAGSAKVWNNAQSDGDAPTGDRGIVDFRRLLAAGREGFRTCYQATLRLHPDAHGRVVLVIVLTPDGEATSVAIDNGGSDITDAEFARCLSAVVRSLKFPRSKRGMESTLRYPLVFDAYPSDVR